MMANSLVDTDTDIINLLKSIRKLLKGYISFYIHSCHLLCRSIWNKIKLYDIVKYKDLFSKTSNIFWIMCKNRIPKAKMQLRNQASYMRYLFRNAV